MQGKVITVSKEKWTIMSGGKTIASRVQVIATYFLNAICALSLCCCLAHTARHFCHLYETYISKTQRELSNACKI